MVLETPQANLVAGMKWLLGTPCVGFLYVAREHVDRLEPPHVGYAGVVRPPGTPIADPLTFRSGARRHGLYLIRAERRLAIMLRPSARTLIAAARTPPLSACAAGKRPDEQNAPRHVGARRFL